MVPHDSHHIYIGLRVNQDTRKNKTRTCQLWNRFVQTTCIEVLKTFHSDSLERVKPRKTNNKEALGCNDTVSHNRQCSAGMNFGDVAVLDSNMCNRYI